MNRDFATCARWIVLAVALLAAGCGAPAVYGSGFVPRTINNQTATPLVMTTVPVVPTATPTTVSVAPAPGALPTGKPSTMDMPGMDALPSAAPVTAVTRNPNATEFVLDDVLYGTPSATATPLSVSVLVTPTSRAGQWHATTVGTPQLVAAVSTQVSSTQSPTTQVTLNPPTVRPTASAMTPQSASGGAVAGNATNGKVLFTGTGGCNACHDVTNGVTIVGPSLKGLASRAGTRKPGMSAADYLHESIVSPNAYVVPGFTAGIMLQTFSQTLTQAQVNDLVAYLLTLK